MKRIKIDRLDKGVNESLESDRIQDNAVVSAINYEYKNSDVLEKRKGVATFTDYEAWGLTPAKFYVWYAPVMPDGATNDIVYFVFTTSNELWITYYVDAWVKEQIIIDDVDYTDTEEITFANGGDKIIIVDDVNKSHFVMFDKDGQLVTSVLEYPAPTNKITFNQMTAWDDSRFEDVITNAYLGDCGEYQYLYCYADRFGNLSNPSPISDTYYIDYFEYSDEGDDDRKVDRIQLFNMALPDGIDNSTKDNLEEFYIYRRTVRYIEGVDVGAFELVKVIKIGKKSTTENDPNNLTTNSWTDTDFVTEGDTPSYGNLAPIATDAIATTGVLMLAGTKTKDVFLWDFKYKCPINISNDNSTNYTDRAIILELHKDSLVDKDGNTPFNPNDYRGSNAGGNYLINKDKMILFDSDQTTPLKTICFDYSSSEYFRVMVSIPQLSSGEKTIYFCFSTSDGSGTFEYTGIPQKYMDINAGIDYGAFMTAGYTGWNRNRTLFGEKVKNANSIICSDFEFLKDGDVINKSDLSNNGEMNDCSIVGRVAKVPFLENYVGYNTLGTHDFPIGTKAVRMDTDTSRTIFSEDKTLPSDGYMYCRVNFNGLDLWDAYYDDSGSDFYNSQYVINNIVCMVTDDTNDHELNFGIFQHTEGNYYLGFVSANLDDDVYKVRTAISDIEYFRTDTDYDQFVFISWKDLNTDNATIKIASVDQNTDTYSSNEITGFDMWGTNNLKSFRIGRPKNWSDNIDELTIDNLIVDQIQLVGGSYITTENNIRNIANFLPFFEQRIIGLDVTQEPYTYNEAIEFEEIEEIDFNDTNRVMWTPVNGLSFNLKDYKDVPEVCKRIIVAPYFLQDTYGNSSIIFTRNRIIRFLLEGTPDEWALRTDNFITEYTQYGLLSKNSLGRFGEALYWHSEVGFMRWDRKGIQLISKNRLEVPIKDTIIGFGVPLRNQYIFHDDSANKSWVYHIDTDVWTIFSGLDVSQVQILSGGDDDNNYNLFLTSTNTIEYYPTTTDETRSSTITTKAYPFDDIDFYKFRMDFEGTGNTIAVTVVNSDETLSYSFPSINRMEWNYLPNGSWGENIQFAITGVTKLKKIEFDINRR